MSDANRKPLVDAAESETLRMRGNSMHGNREILETPASDDAGRAGKAICRTPDTHVTRESDGPIVPEKRANNADAMAATESVEGREPTKGNATQTLLAPDTEPGKRGIRLRGVRAAARRDEKDAVYRPFAPRYPRIAPGQLFRLQRSAAPGVDGMTWREYRRGLEGRLADLHGRVHRGAYRAARWQWQGGIACHWLCQCSGLADLPSRCGWKWGPAHRKPMRLLNRRPSTQATWRAIVFCAEIGRRLSVASIEGF